MKQYIVRPGDFVDKVAHSFGLDPDFLWNDPLNAELREQRRDPNLLCAGDILFLPERSAEGQRVNPATLNRYVTEILTTQIRVGFRDGQEPFANQDCTVTGVGPDPVPGKTDGEGILQLELPVHVENVTVSFPDRGLSYQVVVGALDPVDTLSGQAQRLTNLGYLSQATHLDAASLPAALRSFQRVVGLSDSGIACDRTRAELESAHGR